jgi:hypothetical protein
MSGVGEAYEDRIIGEREVARFVSESMTKPRQHRRITAMSPEPSTTAFPSEGTNWIHRRKH